MEDAWKLLMSVGLPDGAARPPPSGRFDPAAVRAAVREVALSPELTSAKVAPLLAWLSAWSRHWPTCFAEVMGDFAEIFDSLQERLDDENRYLKLRRIALANLAHVL
jgi:hypothetical protein